MSVLNNLNISEPLLVICLEAEKTKYADEIKEFNIAKISTLETLQDNGDSSVTTVVTSLGIEELSSENIVVILKILKHGGNLLILNKSKVKSLEFKLKINGYVNILEENESITASKPKYSVVSSVKLNLKKPIVWKLDGDDEDDLIDPDDLLDDDDLKKPDPSSLKVCGTTGKRKACKDCSCGLAEELATEAQSGKIVDTSDAPKSSCGNCYLGDAFRCASCPYLGMPAFKPGEKIQLTTAQLKSDI